MNFISHKEIIFINLKDFKENKDLFKDMIYKGLMPFLEQFGDDLEEKLYDALPSVESG